jgi:hypothetical protein
LYERGGWGRSSGRDGRMRLYFAVFYLELRCSFSLTRLAELVWRMNFTNTAIAGCLLRLHSLILLTLALSLSLSLPLPPPPFHTAARSFAHTHTYTHARTRASANAPTFFLSTSIPLICSLSHPL